MSDEYQGAFLREAGAAPEARRPVAEGVDDELIRLGVRYRDRTTEPHEPVEAEFEPLTLTVPEEKTGIRWDRIQALGALVAGVGLLFYMVMAGKIDTAYGVLFASGVSAVCGYHLK